MILAPILYAVIFNEYSGCKNETAENFKTQATDDDEKYHEYGGKQNEIYYNYNSQATTDDLT